MPPPDVTTEGTMDTWIELTASQGSGTPKHAGDIHCMFSFVGPPGLAYPQHRPDVESFDDALRLNLQVSILMYVFLLSF